MDFERHVGGSPASPQAVRLLEPTPRGFGRNRAKKEAVPSDWRQFITDVEIYIESAKGLPKQDLLGSTNAYVVVKGIRSNTHLVDIFKTQVERSTASPQWDERFLYNVPHTHGLMDLVGLRLLVYDASRSSLEASFLGSDDFLGGADVDLVEQASGRTIRHELELAGMMVRKGARGVHHKKPRLSIEVKVWREYRPQPPSASDVLLKSLSHYSHVTEIKATVISAQGLRNADWAGKSDPYCVVRAIMLSGKVVELHKTKCIQDCLEPVWDETFVFYFKTRGLDDEDDDDEADGRLKDKEDVFSDEAESNLSFLVSRSGNTIFDEEPVLLAFDIFDMDEGGIMEDNEDDHLGSAYVSLTDCLVDREIMTLKLEGESALLEGRLALNGGETRKLGGEEHRRSLRVPGTGGRTHHHHHHHKKNHEKEMKRSLLAVELSVRREEEPMPEVELVYNGPRELAYGEQAGPGVIGAFEDVTATGGKKNHRRVLKGREKIVFIHGVLHGASGLSNADTFGKSDPYAIIMGVSNDGQRVFIHRTRHINNCLTPQWNEVFSMAIDPLEEIHKLLITVWDSDSDQMVASSSEDDFLGHATLDLSTLPSGEKLRDEMSLLGVKRTRAQGAKTASGFIHDASLSIEVRVEWRVQAYIEFLEEEKLKVRPRHQQSRDPPTVADYIDGLQEDVYATAPQARRVLELHNMGLLAVHGRRKEDVDPQYATRWLQPPREGRRNLALMDHDKDFHDDDLFSNASAKGKYIPHQQRGEGPGFDFSDVGNVAPPQRTHSLPALATRFDRPWASPPGVFQPPRFRKDLERRDEMLRTEMRQMLPPALLSQTVRTISSFY